MYLFQLGRDSNLSKLELISFLYSKNIKYKLIEDSSKYLILDFQNSKRKIIKNLLNKLAGLIRIVNIYYISNSINKKIVEKLDFIEPKKFNYSISTINISKNTKEDIEYLFKSYFKQINVKAVYKRAKISNPKKEDLIVRPKKYFSWKLDQSFELFAIKTNNKYYFGKTISCFNSKQNIYKDKHRPINKRLHTTSFRLADIMINLLNLKKEKTIVDPFCGTGTFLMEILLKKYNAIGIENSNEMYNISKKNIKWLKKKYNINKDCKILKNSAQKAVFKANAAVFEPYMGPFLNARPNYKKAKDIISNLNKLYLDIFKNLNKRLKDPAKIVCILPEFQTINNKIIGIRKDLFKKTGFKKVNVDKHNNKIDLKNPIKYMAADGSKIIRKIYILKKV